MNEISLSYKQRYYLSEMEYWLTNKWLEALKGKSTDDIIKVLGEDLDLLLYKKRVTTILSNGVYWDTDKEWLNELRMRWMRNSLDINLAMSI
jgi:hypothetical protein